MRNIPGMLYCKKTYTDSRFNKRTNYGEKNRYLIENHHEAIISHEVFEAVEAALNQRAKEKGIEKRNDKYQNRYSFSGKIICSECGSTFKRRIHSSGTRKYVAWCCSKHLKQITECSMQFIRDEDIKTAFVTMINKLIFGRKLILQPLLDALRGMSNSDNLSRIQELEKQIEKNAEQRELLVKLMAKGYLEPALFNRENNELQMEADNYMGGQKEALIHALNGELSKVQEVSNLIKFTNKAEMINTFNEQIFNDHIEKNYSLLKGRDRFCSEMWNHTKGKDVRKVAHTPYGYRIENGIAVIDEEKAEKVRNLYKGYLSGLSLSVAAKTAGIDAYHGTAGRMLRNERYLGDDYYPAIIDKETYEKAEAERVKRAKELGRIFEPKKEDKPTISKNFTIGQVIQKHTNPFTQAEYVYSLIESEVQQDGS